MGNSILDSIREKYAGFSNSDKKLADYILSNYSSTKYLSIVALAKNSGVSESTITRFCRHLELGGYHELKLEIAKAEIESKFKPEVKNKSQFDYDTDLHDLYQKIYDINIQAQTDTMKSLDEEAIILAADYLSDARNIYCFGQGSSMIMAMEAWARFSTASSNFIHISDSHMQTMAVSLAAEQDVILFFSYSGSTRDMEDILPLAKKNHVKIILITHFPESQAAKYADVILVCGHNESPLQSGGIAAKIGQLFLIECLFYTYNLRNPENYTKARESTAKAISKKLL